MNTVFLNIYIAFECVVLISDRLYIPVAALRGLSKISVSSDNNLLLFCEKLFVLPFWYHIITTFSSFLSRYTLSIFHNFYEMQPCYNLKNIHANTSGTKLEIPLYYDEIYINSKYIIDVGISIYHKKTMYIFLSAIKTKYNASLWHFAFELDVLCHNIRCSVNGQWQE